MSVSGGCQCGAVRFRVEDGGLGGASICHCRMCQKAFGAFFGPLVNAKHSHLTWTRGAPSYFRSSETVRRGFCQACGTPLTYEVDGRPSSELAIGAFDDPTIVPPTKQYSVHKRLPFVPGLADLPTRILDIDGAPSNRQHPDHDTDNWTPHA